MKVKEGYFKDEQGNRVIYEIHERVTDATYWFEYWKIDDIFFYSRRKNQHNIEVGKAKLKVFPKAIRTLSEYEKLIKEFYKENTKDLVSYSFFSCDIRKIDNTYKLELLDHYRAEVNAYLNKTQMSEEELAEYIYTNKKSPYTR